ncbi:MAG: response regulator transcription factor [Chloroflexales bacterium]|nr:response regulator transcription factor [Chloroflexales bacterium]
MTAKPMIRVLLVDDHAVVRGGLRYFLDSVVDIEVVGEADNGAQALAQVAALAPDVVVMDLMMPEMDGIAATQQLHERFPHVHVLALTSFAEGELVQRALQAGAIGYLLKDTAGSDLVEAIRKASAGAPILAPQATQALVSNLNAPPRPGGDLSDRELAVLRLMLSGLSNEQIAEQLFISRNTVRHHVHNTLVKLGATNRTEAVSLAIQHRLVELPWSGDDAPHEEH